MRHAKPIGLPPQFVRQQEHLSRDEAAHVLSRQLIDGLLFWGFHWTTTSLLNHEMA